jgi:cytochrome d ubiquinol oxidase subunit I
MASSLLGFLAVEVGWIVTGYVLLLGLYRYVVGRIIRAGPPSKDELTQSDAAHVQESEVMSSD